MSNHHRPSVEEAFNPELRQAEAEWNEYLDSRPYKDEQGNVHAPNGQFANYNTLADNARSDHYHESMDRPWEELNFSELADELAWAELHNDETVANDVSDVLLDKMIDFTEKNGLDSDAQTNLNNRILRLIDNKKELYLTNGNLELPAESSRLAPLDSRDVSRTEGADSESEGIISTPEVGQSEPRAEISSDEEHEGSNTEKNPQVIQARLDRIIDEIADFGEADDSQLQSIEQLVDQLAALSSMNEDQREQLLDEQLSKAGVSQERFNEFVVDSDSANNEEESDQANGKLKAVAQRTGEKIKSAAARSNLLLGKMFYKVGDTLSRKQAELSDNEKVKRGRKVVLATGAVALGGAIFYAQQKGWLDGITDSLPFGAGDTGAEGGIAEQVDVGEGLPSEVGPAEESGIDFTGDIPDEIAEGEASIDFTGDIPDEIAGGEAPDAGSGESQTGAGDNNAGTSSAGTDGEQAQQIDITNEMRSVRPGQGWYETFQNLNISPSGWSELLDVVGPELESMNLAYPDGSGSYGISSTADLPDDALQLILSKARELGIG